MVPEQFDPFVKPGDPIPHRVRTKRNEKERKEITAKVQNDNNNNNNNNKQQGIEAGIRHIHTDVSILTLTR